MPAIGIFEDSYHCNIGVQIAVEEILLVRGIDFFVTVSKVWIETLLYYTTNLTSDRFL